jgi:hypothetical protein
MKKVLIIIMGYLLWAAILYLAFAFIKVEPNAFKWSEDARIFLISFSFLYLAFIIPIYALISDMNL